MTSPKGCFTKAAAEAVCGAMERGGVNVWMAPRDIAPGASWAGAIVEAIDNARAVVLIFSSVANDSPQIEREVQRALEKNLRVIPFRIENVKPREALAYCIGAVQWLDAFAPPMSAHYEELLRVVRRIAPPQPSPTPSGAFKPPPRSQRLPAIVAGVGGLLVVSALVAWEWPKSNLASNPSLVSFPPTVQPTKPEPSQPTELPQGPTSQASASESGDFGILFGSQKEGPKDSNGPMNEIRKARQIPNSPDPVLYKKNGLWMSVVVFDSEDARKPQLQVFKGNFPAAKVAPIQLSEVCPNRRILAGKEGEIPEQIECAP